MTDPITPTGKAWWDTDATVADKRCILAIEREAREPTDDGFWADVDTLAAAMEQAVYDADDDGDFTLNAAAIIQAAKEAERE